MLVVRILECMHIYEQWKRDPDCRPRARDRSQNRDHPMPGLWDGISTIRVSDFWTQDRLEE